MPTPPNYFAYQEAAERYAKGRPDFHTQVMHRIREFLGIEHKLETALDIACGTGLSTKALLEIAENVYGTDMSPSMLEHATQNEHISYHTAPAENQPFSNQSIDIITVCSGVHWFDIDAFLNESHRLLRSRRWLVLYDNFFNSSQAGLPDFSSWYQQRYLGTFLAPPRNDSYSWTKEHLATRNFDLLGDGTFTNEVAFTQQELILYFTTQSNIISAVTEHGHSYDEIERWLLSELSPFFRDAHARQTVSFGNRITYLQKLI
ncbi:MAG: methyltransferase domain-containing protein [Ignavibacteria bacterium]|nr:methyltransferase domain-containing protein [Ignavibacteria bacterium]